MNLIVRTQDRTRLLIVNNLNARQMLGHLYQSAEELEKNKNAFGIYTYINNAEILLGIYKDKDRALEILDEIVSILNHEHIFTVNDEAKFDIEELESGIIGPYYNNSGQAYKLDLVYNMPEK